MAYKRSTEQTKSKDNEQHADYPIGQHEQCFFEVSIKREAKLFSKWKERRCIVVYVPKSQLSLTIKSKDKGTIEEIINLKLAKMSKRCSLVEDHHCFGLEIASGKRYLIGRETEARTLVMFQKLVRLKKDEKEHSSSLQNSRKIQSIKEGSKVEPPLLQFEKSNYDQQDYVIEKRDQKIPHLINSNGSHLKKEEPTIEWEIEVEQKQIMRQEKQLIREQNEDEYRTVMEQEPIVVERQPQVHLKLPITAQEMGYLQSDEGFKLRTNFRQGRILEKKATLVKVNLLLKSHFTEREILECFFHLELWNQGVRRYELINRIDEGIYLMYAEFKKLSFFSSPRYCYMMATSVMIGEEQFLILKSMDQDNFEPVSGCSWVDLSIWVKVRGCQEQSMVKFLSLCLKVGNEKDFELGLSLCNYSQVFQSFLLTTGKLPYQILEWRKLGNDNNNLD